MEEKIEAAVLPEKVWEVWERAHALSPEGGLVAGKKGRTQGGKGFRYHILDVKRGESFSILWKSLYARLLFTQSVKPTAGGCEISYRFQIRGPFAWPLRWFLEKKIRKNLIQVLQATVKQLENGSAGS